MTLLNSVTSETQVRHHIPSLNGIRACSVLLVVTGHCGFGKVVPGGLGVTIFFFLSGFLITTLLLEEQSRTNDISLKKFYARRLLRLSPPLLVTLLLAVLLVLAGLLPGGVTLKGLAAQVFYLANYYQLFWDAGNSTPAGTGVLWSLAVEEHFYFVYPAVLLLVTTKLPRTSLIWILLASCICVLAWRIHLASSPGFVSYRTYYATDTRIDSILYGCLLALLRNSGPLLLSPKAASLLLGLGIAALLASLLIRSEFFRETFRYTLQGLALMPIFFAIDRHRRGVLFNVLNSKVMDKLGEYSYALYLSHYVIAQCLAKLTGLDNFPYLYLPVVLVLAYWYAKAINVFVERPTLVLRHRLRSDDGRPTRVMSQQAV